MAAAKAAQDCACFNLRKAARAITQMYDAAIEPSGMRATQFSVLQVISLSDGAPMMRVAQRLGMDRTTLTRNLAPLERLGWVRSEPGPDRRERTLALTRSGRSALERAKPFWQAAQERIIGKIGAAQWQALRSGLDALVAAAQEGASAPAKR
ncbi:MAG TPA: MarR family winged helix-turn-helix transcriptional regulator [Alphaproteobacteria bacterium]|nr:MarR family winged helix-turn-helix transcriptional regulator [Alphaproteobacteria bacterium]